MRLFVVLHVLTMFGAVALSGGVELFLVLIARSRDPHTIRTVFKLHGRLVRWVPIAFMVGLGFGVIAIFVHGFDPFAPWLLLAYPLFVAGILTGALGIGPWADGVSAAAADSGDTASPALVAAIASPRGRNAAVAFWVVVAAIIYVMVAKPLS
jgi:hypothetical protein